MIPALLLTTPDIKVVAGEDGINAGFVDGTGNPFPGVTIGSVNFPHPVFNDVTLHGIYTDTSVSQFHIAVSAAVADLQDMTITIGSDVYTNSDYMGRTNATNGARYNYSLKNALVDGTTYTFKVE